MRRGVPPLNYGRPMNRHTIWPPIGAEPHPIKSAIRYSDWLDKNGELVGSCKTPIPGSKQTPIHNNGTTAASLLAIGAFDYSWNPL
jgi:hypothetical protein